MIKINQKKGQFYLIAAIIIVGIVIGFAAVTNYYKRGGISEKKVYFLSSELDIEGSYVVDYSVYRNQDSTELLKKFAEEYGKYAGEDRSIFFVFGDKNKIVVATYEDYISGSITYTGGGTPTTIGQNIEDKNFRSETCVSGNPDCDLSINAEKITIYIKHDGEEIPYEFNLNEGENFYFVISQDIPGRGRIVLDKPTNEGGRIKLSPSN